MTDSEYTTEYWVHEIYLQTAEVVATFPTEAAASEWADREYDTVHDWPPTGAPTGAFIREVKRFHD